MVVQARMCQLLCQQPLSVTHMRVKVSSALTTTL